MEDDVRDAEHRREDGERLERLLHAALDVDPDALLEVDDLGGMAHRRLDVLARHAPYDLVEAVQERQGAELVEP